MSSWGRRKKDLKLFFGFSSWFLKHKKGMFFHTEASKEASETLTKGEKWVSEMKMLQEFSQEEFTMHLNSGRILWRSDPWTPGVYNYCDQGDQSKQTVLKRKNKVTAGQERELETEEASKDHRIQSIKGFQVLSCIVQDLGNPAIKK